MNLNNPGSFKKIDKDGVYDSLMLFSEQVKTSWKQAVASGIPQIFAKSVLVSGMGGSSNAAKILQGVFEDDLDYPFEVRSDYGLPGWVDENTLVVANSYSGNTEETLSAVEAANKIGAKVLGVTTGGKIGEMVKSNAVLGVVIDPGKTNPTGFPKTGLGVSLGALAGALSRAGVLPIKEETILSEVDELIKIRDGWNAKKTAEWLHGGVPVLFGGKPLTGALNAGRNAMCEISRNFTQFYDFPEMNHVLIEALQKPEHAKHNKYLFFESVFNHQRVQKRFRITKGILDEMGLEHATYELRGKTKLAQALELPHYCGWLGFYISMLDGTDPGPEPWIVKLKDSLAQPVH
jgi:glucose/mannose-6-phosphate isomerase